MAILGSADGWSDTFPGDLVPRILELVLEVWRGLDKPSGADLETHITRRLRIALVKAKNLQTLPFQIHRETAEDDMESSGEKGRIDLYFTAGWREDVYFAFECKRLRVRSERKLRSLATEYVTEGMCRFVTGQYAVGLTCGGMLGYVMDGKVQTAMQSVDRAVRSRVSKLQMRPPGGLEGRGIKSGGAGAATTRHMIRNPDFVMHHLFVPVA
jgi:hypothetical protein